MPSAQVVDLLDHSVYRNLIKNPKILEEYVRAGSKVIIIDEVQRIPQLLDEVHRIIFNHGTTFLLTGSSARKLRKGSANLLAGRAFEAQLYPLTFMELGKDFELLKILNRGGLPAVFDSLHYREELQSYIGLYLQQEIKAEAVTRNLSAFAEFLELIAKSNGEEINYQQLASDSQVSPNTLKSYLEVLQDTLIGFQLTGFTQSKKRKAVSRSKHFLFDIGVTNCLARTGEIVDGNYYFGKNFEHFIVLEMRAYLSYTRSNLKLYYWRTHSQFEVDLIVDNKIAIEIKSTQLVNDQDLKGLRALKEEGMVANYCIVSRDPVMRKTKDQIVIYPYQQFLQDLWGGALIKKNGG